MTARAAERVANREREISSLTRSDLAAAARVGRTDGESRPEKTHSPDAGEGGEHAMHAFHTRQTPGSQASALQGIFPRILVARNATAHCFGVFCKPGAVVAGAGAI